MQKYVPSSHISGWLSGAHTRSGAGEGTRVAWAGQAAGRAIHSHPDFAWYQDDSQAWRVLEKVKEIGNSHGMLYTIFR